MNESGVPPAPSAPAAPGALDQVPAVDDMLDYLVAIRKFRDGAKDLLEVLDATLAGDTDSMLAHAVWNTVDQRVEKLVATWDSGRADLRVREELAALMWARLDGGVSADLAVSFVESVTLLEALLIRLRERVVVGDDLVRRRAALVDRADALAAAIESTRVLAERCAEKIVNAPAVSLPRADDYNDRTPPGQAPGPTELSEWAARLAEAETAVGALRDRCSALLARRADLRGLAESYRAMAGAKGLGEDRTLGAQWTAIHRRLWSAPCDLDAAAAEVADYQESVRAAVARLASTTSRRDR